MQIKRFQGYQLGVTLIEACTVLAIVAVLAGITLPAVDGMLKTLRLRGQADELALDLRFVRSEAVSRNEGVRMSFQTLSSGTCMIVHTGAATDCACDEAGVAHCTSGARALKTNFHAANGGILIYSNVVSMRFDPRNGTVTPTATVRVVGSAGQSIHHVVNVAGRVRSCTPGGALTGMKAC